MCGNPSVRQLNKHEIPFLRNFFRSGRWATLDCSLALPYACVEENSVESGLKWSINLDIKGPFDKAVCSDSYLFGAPHNGYSNSLLVNAGLGQTMWLNAWNPLKST